MEGLRHFQLINCTTELRISEIALFEKILDCMDPYMAHKTVLILTIAFLFLKTSI